jgi:hypothetical protein
MECIRRLKDFFSKQQCTYFDCKSSNAGFQKCDDSSCHSVEKQKKPSNSDELNQSIHKDISDQELLEPEETSDISESFENNENVFVDDSLVPDNNIVFYDNNNESFDNINIDDFNNDHNTMEN